MSVDQSFRVFICRNLCDPSDFLQHPGRVAFCAAECDREFLRFARIFAGSSNPVPTILLFSTRAIISESFFFTKCLSPRKFLAAHSFSSMSSLPLFVTGAPRLVPSSYRASRTFGVELKTGTVPLSPILHLQFSSARKENLTPKSASKRFPSDLISAAQFPADFLVTKACQ
jgi:hypothetical protein